ncbi:MAG: CARDB domain-containing protein [Solirubrobacterales bacterium]
MALLALAPSAIAKPQLPNFVVKKVSRPGTTFRGSRLRVVLKVRNKGRVPAGRSKLAIYLNVGNSHKSNPNQLLKRVGLGRVRSRRMVRRRIGVRIPASTPVGSYRLIVCADSLHKVAESSEHDNCRPSHGFAVIARSPTPSSPVSPSPPPPAPAFTTTDDLDWGLNENAALEFAGAGQPVVTTLRAANGVPGQAGYSQSGASPQPFAKGDVSRLTFGDPEDAAADVALPFAFPFGGIYEDSVSVSTNGWLGFGTSPALDSFPHGQRTDYRGIAAVVGDFYRGLMPFWSDLDVVGGENEVREVVPADRSFVAFQWEVEEAGSGVMRTFQVVLFPDGRFRFDYPGENRSGDKEAFVGYSLGTGPGSARIVAEDLRSAPPASILFTPDTQLSASSLPPGKATLTLPPGSTFTSADPSCALSQAPTATEAGLVSCMMPSLPPGRQASSQVHFAMPTDAPGESEPPNFRYRGQFASGASTLSDIDEIDALNRNLEPSRIGITPQFSGGPPQEGVPMNFEPIIQSFDGGLDEPTAFFTFTDATISSIKIDGDPIDCTYSGDYTATCALPSGMLLTEVEIVVVPVSTSTVTFSVTAEALNAPPVTEGIGVSP